MGDIQTDINRKICELLNGIDSLFQDTNELAYITLQQKNERQIRDKVAYELQKYLDSKDNGTYIVRCEWPSSSDGKNLDYKDSGLSGRKAVDMAILKMNDNRTDYDKVVALVEFKSQSFLNDETWPVESFKDDVEKMARFTKLPRRNNQGDLRIQDADLYFIMGVSSHNKRNCPEYASAVAYKDILDLPESSLDCRKSQLFNEQNPQVYVDKMKSFAQKFVLNGNPATTITETKPIGSSFEYNLYQTFIVWGPYKAQ